MSIPANLLTFSAGSYKIINEFIGVYFMKIKNGIAIACAAVNLPPRLSILSYFNDIPGGMRQKVSARAYKFLFRAVAVKHSGRLYAVCFRA